MAKKKNAFNELLSLSVDALARNPTADDLKIAGSLGIKKINSANDWKQINDYRAQFEKTKGDPFYTQVAKSLGIKSYDSTNDYAQVLKKLTGGLTSTAGAAAPASAAPTPEAAPVYKPEPLVAAPVEAPQMPMSTSSQSSSTEQKYSPGGSSAALEGGAMGFRRRKSSARLAGLTSKGTSRFKINGQTSTSSGLNIGV
jgi:hypothetical protein